MESIDRKLLTCITGLIGGILVKYFLWTVNMIGRTPLSDLGNSLVQNILSITVIISVIGVIWFGVCKK